MVQKSKTVRKMPGSKACHGDCNVGCETAQAFEAANKKMHKARLRTDDFARLCPGNSWKTSC